MNTTAPSLDTWTSLFLLASSFGFFLAILLLINPKSRHKNNLPIVLLLFGFSLILVQYVFIWTGYRKIYPYAYFFDICWYYWFGPLLYTYAIRFYRPNEKISFVHFLPGTILFLLSGYYLIKTGGHFGTPQPAPGLRLLLQMRSPWAPVLSFIIYSLWIRQLVQDASDTQQQSVLEKTREKWIKTILRFFGLFGTAYASYYILVSFPFFNLQWDYAISLTMSIGIYGIGYMVFARPQIFNGELFSALFLPPEKDNLNPDTYQQFYEELCQYLADKKPYLDPDLRLVHLADQVNLSPHLLSKLINEKAGCNFNQFINGYRIREAEEQLKTDLNLPIKSIYFSVGFNNKASFNHHFKAKNNCTPTAYRDRFNSSSTAGKTEAQKG